MYHSISWSHPLIMHHQQMISWGTSQLQKRKRLVSLWDSLRKLRDMPQRFFLALLLTSAPVNSNFIPPGDRPNPHDVYRNIWPRSSSRHQLPQKKTVQLIRRTGRCIGLTVKHRPEQNCSIAQRHLPFVLFRTRPSRILRPQAPLTIDGTCSGIYVFEILPRMH
ncbi:hypothetical protein BDN72DRAFT_465520 [Pluteus cervinus]|uniref:Uncharacterized protein n=1 Tax=Pluteus cervinus TaxID=181527 RepID=A0ACD3A6S9_9AGAR|nr:hypothetical protein BDN72DRAFT_465520 [Pluteus cervinus]